MKKSRILFVVGIIITYYYFFWDSSSDISLEEQKLTDAFAEHCQFLEYPLTGHEGSKENHDLKLKGIVVTFRHGERSALVPGLTAPLSLIDCTAYHAVDRASFEDYVKFTESEDFEKFLILDKQFKGFPLIPDRSKCKFGEMTAEGALQLIRLGNFLKEKYSSKTSLFKNELNITVASSFYHRTLQSCIAFLSGFLYPQEKEITIQASKTTYFCLEADCTCEQVQMTRDQFLKERSKLYLDRYADLHSNLEIIAKPIGIPHLSHPFELVDAVLGSYACRRHPLPCFANGECITISTINKAAQTAEDLILNMFPKSLYIRRLYAAESYPIAHSVVTMVDALRKEPHKNHIKVFSGHDITIIPLLLTLGLKNYTIPPPYSSRLLFEVYESNTFYNGENLFVRVLYNGIDKTMDLKFCQVFHHGLCSAKDLSTFVNSQIKKWSFGVIPFCFRRLTSSFSSVMKLNKVSLSHPDSK